VLAAAAREYDRQSRLTALAVSQALRLEQRGSLVVAASVQQYQAAAVALSLESLTAVLDEQGIDDASEASVRPGSLLTGTQATAAMLDNASTTTAFTQLIETLVRDASRTARAVDQATRPAVTGYVRSLRPPSCSRCAVLAGRVYRHSEGFQRHPHCDCLMTPTNQTIGPTLVTDPQEALDKGWIRGLSKGDKEALDAGADLGQVVNVRRKAAGLTVGSSVMVRAGRLTPEGCLEFAGSRADALGLLRRYGYIT
jgi:hypothetical protein